MSDKLRMKYSFYFLFSLLLLPFCGYAQSPADTGRVFVIVQEQPKFNGDLYKYLGDHLNYSPKNGEPSQGVVYVQFTVERNGSLSDVHVLKNVGHTIDSVAVACIKGMPTWIPGKQNNQPVRVQYNIPIRFDAPVIEQNSVNPTTPPKVK